MRFAAPASRAATNAGGSALPDGAIYREPAARHRRAPADEERGPESRAAPA